MVSASKPFLFRWTDAQLSNHAAAGSLAHRDDLVQSLCTCLNVQAAYHIPPIWRRNPCVFFNFVLDCSKKRGAPCAAKEAVGAKAAAAPAVNAACSAPPAADGTVVAEELVAAISSVKTPKLETPRVSFAPSAGSTPVAGSMPVAWLKVELILGPKSSRVKRIRMPTSFRQLEEDVKKVFGLSAKDHPTFLVSDGQESIDVEDDKDLALVDPGNERMLVFPVMAAEGAVAQRAKRTVSAQAAPRTAVDGAARRTVGASVGDKGSQGQKRGRESDRSARETVARSGKKGGSSPGSKAPMAAEPTVQPIAAEPTVQPSEENMESEVEKVRDPTVSPDPVGPRGRSEDGSPVFDRTRGRGQKRQSGTDSRGGSEGRSGSESGGGSETRGGSAAGGGAVQGSASVWHCEARAQS